MSTHDEARLAESTREAWTSYRASLAGLAGPEYDEAEKDQWARLQASLRTIDSEREQLLAEASAQAA